MLDGIYFSKIERYCIVDNFIKNDDLNEFATIVGTEILTKIRTKNG